MPQWWPAVGGVLLAGVCGGWMSLRHSTRDVVHIATAHAPLLALHARELYGEGAYTDLLEAPLPGARCTAKLHRCMLVSLPELSN